MKRNHVAVIVAGLVLSALLAVVSIYLTGIGIILVIALAMSFQIMEDTERLTDLAVGLSENAKSLIIINKGNMLIRNIAVTVIPLNVEFVVPELAVDEKFTFDFHQIINEARAAVEFEDVNGRKYNKSFELSALRSDDDLLKPMMPLFDWKEKR
jgi:hypothetical protein